MSLSPKLDVATILHCSCSGITLFPFNNVKLAWFAKHGVEKYYIINSKAQVAALPYFYGYSATFIWSFKIADVRLLELCLTLLPEYKTKLCVAIHIGLELYV